MGPPRGVDRRRSRLARRAGEVTRPGLEPGLTVPKTVVLPITPSGKRARRGCPCGACQAEVAASAVSWHRRRRNLGADDLLLVDAGHCQLGGGPRTVPTRSLSPRRTTQGRTPARSGRGTRGPAIRRNPERDLPSAATGRPMPTPRPGTNARASVADGSEEAKFRPPAADCLSAVVFLMEAPRRPAA